MLLSSFGHHAPLWLALAMGFAAAFSAIDGMVRLVAKALALKRWVEVDATLEDLNLEAQGSKLDIWKKCAIQLRYSYRYRGQEFKGDKVSVLDTMKGMGGSYPVSLGERLSGQYAAKKPLKAWLDPVDPQQSFLVQVSLSRQILMYTAGLMVLALILVGFSTGFLMFAPVPLLTQAEGVGFGVALYLFWRLVLWK